MKKMNFVFVAFFLISLIWAMYERSSKSALLQKVQRLEAEYLKKTKDTNFLEDKVNSLKEKVDVLVAEKDELFKSSLAKDEYITSLEKKLKSSLETITQLEQKTSNLEKLLKVFQAESTPPGQE